MRGFCDHESWGGVGMAVPDRVALFRAQVRHLADSSLELDLSALDETASSMRESWTETWGMFRGRRRALSAATVGAPPTTPSTR